MQIKMPHNSHSASIVLHLVFPFKLHLRQIKILNEPLVAKSLGNVIKRNVNTLKHPSGTSLSDVESCLWNPLAASEIVNDRYMTIQAPFLLAINSTQVAIDSNR